MSGLAASVGDDDAMIEVIERGAEKAMQDRNFKLVSHFLKAYQFYPYDHRPMVGWLSTEITALDYWQQFLRFREAGDDLMQVVILRNLIQLSDTRIAPMDEAVTEFQKLKEKNPEVTSDASQLVLEELESFRESMNRLMIRSRMNMNRR